MLRPSDRGNNLTTLGTGYAVFLACSALIGVSAIVLAFVVLRQGRERS